MLSLHGFDSRGIRHRIYKVSFFFLQPIRACSIAKIRIQCLLNHQKFNLSNCPGTYLPLGPKCSSSTERVCRPPSSNYFRPTDFHQVLDEGSTDSRPIERFPWKFIDERLSESPDIFFHLWTAEMSCFSVGVMEIFQLELSLNLITYQPQLETKRFDLQLRFNGRSHPTDADDLAIASHAGDRIFLSITW